MKKIVFILYALVTVLYVQAQQDNGKKTGKEKRQAKKIQKWDNKAQQAANMPDGDKKAALILDAMSKKYKAYKTFQAKFTYTLENKAENIKETQSGTISTSGHNFRIEFAGQEIYCDNKTIWTYNKEVNEVSVNDYNPKDADINPAEIFTLYQKGFLYRYVDEKNENGRMVQNIELTPKDKKKSYFKIRLTIDKVASQIIRSVIYDKNGNIYTYQVNKQSPNPKLDASFFLFDKKKYPGVQVIDLR